MIRKRLTILAVTAAAGITTVVATAPAASADVCKPLSYFPAWSLCTIADQHYLCSQDNGKVHCWRSEPAPRDPKRTISDTPPIDDPAVTDIVARSLG